ncbi:hypothetical protein [Bacillus paralicheniformis]|uniref:hypothetical protein n=1 Tax=Bacillus paralicheniformis TaxID=1648923 RepID=UPI001E372A64|nr:hypothetical protein [Bacillus paralicheniformis]MCB6217146.1 hypothetical protein [Bacillus paralicheniformis]
MFTPAFKKTNGAEKRNVPFLINKRGNCRTAPQDETNKKTPSSLKSDQSYPKYDLEVFLNENRVTWFGDGNVTEGELKMVGEKTFAVQGMTEAILSTLMITMTQ